MHCWGADLERLPAGCGAPARDVVVDLVAQPLTPLHSGCSNAVRPHSLSFDMPTLGLAIIAPHTGSSTFALGAGGLHPWLRPGCASASATQVDAMLARLAMLEETVAVQQRSERKLKDANLALMARLADFQVASDANAKQAETELMRMHRELSAFRAAHRAAETTATHTVASLSGRQAESTRRVMTAHGGAASEGSGTTPSGARAPRGAFDNCFTSCEASEQARAMKTAGRTASPYRNSHRVPRPRASPCPPGSAQADRGAIRIVESRCTSTHSDAWLSVLFPSPPSPPSLPPSQLNARRHCNRSSIRRCSLATPMSRGPARSLLRL